MPSKKRTILIVGGLAAGPSAAAKAARTNPNAEVIMFEATDTISYGMCETPYVIGGDIADEKRLIAYSPQRLQEEKGVTVKTLHKVEKILPNSKKILVRDLKAQSVSEFAYDKLILATGAKSKKLNLEGEDARNVFHLNNRENALGILNFLEKEAPKKAVIIGGGYIGMEMCEAFRKKGLEVTILHRHKLPMSGVEQEAKEQILSELERNDVAFIGSTKIEGFYLSKSNSVKFVHTNKGAFEADIVLVAVGVQPNAALAKSTRIRLGTFGGILTDERQQTNVDGIYAAGDCCEVKNIISGKYIYVPLATYASRAAWVAGENAAGGRATFKGGIRAMAVKVFDMAIANVGLSFDEAKEAGFQVVKETITAYDKVGIMPGSGKTTIHLLIDQKSKRILGANVTGKEGVALRANALGIVIQQKLTIDEVSRLDFIYTPPFAPLWDPVLVAANQAKKRLG